MTNPAANDPDIQRALQQIVESPTYRRADHDLDFMARYELRPTRLQIEFLKPEIYLQETGINATVVVFGGTRVVEPQEALENAASARKEVERNPDDAICQRRLDVAERLVKLSHFYEVARDFGRIVGRHGGESKLVIVTGGGPGLMEAANRGANEVGAKSIGFNITLPREQRPNPFITPELCFQFRYFALRKMHFLLRARALVAFPGGYGTLDELFDALCLIQTRKIKPLPVILVGQEYWRGAFDADFLAREGTIDYEDIELFSYAETSEEIWQGIGDWYERSGEPLYPEVSDM